MKKALSIIFGLGILTGCFEKDEPVDPYPRGDVQEQTAELGRKYTHQVFYSFEQNAVVKSVMRTDWDIAFNSSADNHTLYLNTGNTLYAAESGETDLTKVQDTSGLEFKWDWSNGYDDSTALVGWDQTDKVYVIDLGLDLSSDHRGFAKVKFSLNGQDLQMEYGMIGETEMKKATLVKDDLYNRVYFSFVSDAIVDIEPPKTDYDIVFRQYIYYFEEEDLPYNVVGALLNPYKTRAAAISNIEFLDIALADTFENQFKPSLDVVGYDWKFFNLDEGFYQVFPEKCFILQSSEGFYYKFHFTDYYNTEGDRGYPKIEWKLL